MKRKLVITKKGKLEDYKTPVFTFFDGYVGTFWLPDVVVSNISYSYPSDSPIIVETLIDVSIK
jgi:hypothetical protein